MTTRAVPSKSLPLGSFPLGSIPYDSGVVPPPVPTAVEQGGGVPYWPTYESYDRWRKQKKVREKVFAVDSVMAELGRVPVVAFDAAEEDLAELLMLVGGEL